MYSYAKIQKMRIIYIILSVKWLEQSNFSPQV